MKLGLARLSTSGAALAAGLLLAAAAQAADDVTVLEEDAALGAQQLSQVTGARPLRVYRGSGVETLRFDPASRADSQGADSQGADSQGADSQGVVVFRGTTEPEEPPLQEAPDAEPQAQLWASSGRDLWFYDPEGETLRACRLFKASRVGRYKIRCFERRLH